MKQRTICMITWDIYYKRSTRVCFLHEIYKYFLAVYMTILFLWKKVGALLMRLLIGCVDLEFINVFYIMVVKKSMLLNSSQLLHLMERWNFSLVARCSLLFVRCSLLVTFCSFVARYFLLVASYFLLVAQQEILKDFF